jgi:hypothetical protein
MSRLRTIAVVVATLSLPASAAAQVDAVTHWNTIIVNATQTGRAGPHSLLDIALAQAAVHDAVQVIDGKYQPYAYAAPANPSASRGAAVAAAAHRVLELLYPGQEAALDLEYNTYVANNGLAGNAGLAIGEAAGQALYDDHYRPILPVAQPPATTGIGEWRTAGNFGFYYMSVSTPFTLNRVDQFRPQPPPPMTSTRYLRDYDEVALIGNAAHHPNSDTDRARFWSGNFIVQWNESVRQLAEAHVPDTGERARLFALINLAAADAAMAVWDAKAFYNFWRPITAIAEGDLDPNHKTKTVPGWSSLIPSPPYPDYVSGANGLTGAFTGMLRLFFGTDSMTFTVKNPAMIIIDKERDYTSFSQAAQEVVDARVLLGIHFRFADEEGRRLGERVAHWTFQKFLRPVPGTK